MKRLTNILSYLWLLLLMAVTACSDMEETIDPMLMEGEVELTIQTEVSGMEAGTRAVPTDEVNTIVALAFDESNALIKKVDAILTNKQTTNGTLKIKVPKRTRTIHFLGNYTKEAIASIETIDALQALATDDMTTIRYWGKATFDGTNASLPVTLYRNIAKVTLTLGEGLTGYIAGFLNYHTQGSIVPGNSTVGTLNAVGNKASHGNGNLGTEYYLFEHANSGENLYAICNIGGSYYKVAFATNNNGGLNHFSIVRNHKYNINIKEVETALGSGSYDEAKDRNPINNAVVTEVNLSVNANLTELYYNKNNLVTVTAKVPEGVSALNITADNFDVITTSGNVTKTSDYNYTVNSSGDVAFTFTLKDGTYTNNQTVTIQFAGTAAYGYEVINPEAINITLKQANTVNIMVAPSATTLNYADSPAVEDLLVNVTIPKEVTRLTFSSSDFTIKVASGELVAVENEESVYTITHADGAESSIVPVRIRLNKGVSSQTASFTFSGTANDESVIVEEASTTINLTPDEDTYVRWQGSVPLSENDSTMVPLLYDWFCRSGEAIIDVSSRLKFEFEVTNSSESYFEITEIRGNGISNGWNDPKFNFSDLEDGYRYNAITSGNGPVIVTMDQDVFDIIKENYQTKFLGDTDVAMAIRGKGITLTKVSIFPAVELPTVAITASPYTTLLNYSTNAASDLTVNVTIPKEVTTLTFKSDYFDVGVVVDTLLTAPNNGTYTVVHPENENTTTSTPIRLRLKKNVTGTASFTFSGVGDDVKVTSAVVDNITLTQIVDDNIRWHGDAALEWGVNAVQIPLLYSWFYDESNQLKVPVGSTLRVEYETTSQSDAIIQFAEVNGEWNDDAYYFSELRVETNNNGNTEVMGLNLAQNTGIYENNRTTFDLKLTQDVLTNMTENRTNLLGETDVVMAIQGGNVRLKSISVIPNNNPVTGDILLTLPNGQTQNVVSTSLNYGTGNSIEEFTLDVTVPDGVTQINITADDFNVSWSTGGGSVSTEKTYTFSESAESRTKRFKFTLNNKTTKTSTITVRDNNNNATAATATINLSPRPTDSDGGTTIWSGTAQLEWSINYLSISNVIPKGYKVRLNFTSVGGAFKFHDGNGQAFKLGKEDYTHQENNDTYLNVPAGTTYYEFEVNDIIEGTNISNGLQGFKLNGDNVTMTSIVIYPPEEVEAVETVIYTGPFTFDNWNNMPVEGTFKVGTKVTFKFSTGGIFKIHNGSWQMLYIPSLADRYPQEGYNIYIEVVAGEELSFVVSNDIRFQSMNYETNKQTEDVEFTGESFSGLVLQGDGGTVLESITTTTYGTTP